MVAVAVHHGVAQALYFCKPFRDKVLQYAATLPKGYEENLLNCLAELFVQVGPRGGEAGGGRGGGAVRAVKVGWEEGELAPEGGLGGPEAGGGVGDRSVGVKRHAGVCGGQATRLGMTGGGR